MKIKVIFFIVISFYCTKTGFSQLALITTLEAALKDLDPDILHDRENIEKITWGSYLSDNQIDKPIHSYMTFDSLGRNLEVAYFSKDDIVTPYKRAIKSYTNDFCEKVVLQNSPEGIDTVGVMKFFYKNEVLQSEDIQKIYKNRRTINGVLKIKENRKKYQIFYEYDTQGNLVKKEELKEGVRKVKESNSYEYDDKMRIKSKKYKIHFFGAITGESFSEYDSLGNLTTETIIEDTVKVIHHYSDEIIDKSEMFFTKRGGKVIVEYDFEGKMILLKGKTVNGTITQKYEYDRRGNWIKKYSYEQIGDEQKRLKGFSEREIFYRN